jgi:diguanylate cyclase (GGDEF)-like protein
MSSPGSSWTRQHLLSTVGAVTLVAVTLVVIAGVHDASLATPDASQVVIALLALMLADSALVDIRTGSDAESVTFAEAMLAIALLLLPWSFLLPLAGLAVLLAHALRGRTLVKTMFNASSFVVGCALASIVIKLGDVPTLGSIAAYDIITLTAALIVFWAWNGAATATVVAMSAGRRIRDVYAAGAIFRTWVGAANIAAGIAIVVMARWAPPALAVLPPILGLLYVVYRGYLGASRDVAYWRQLETATKELNQLDGDAVAQAALRHAQALFQATWVELVLTDSGQPVTYRIDDGTSTTQAGVTETCAMVKLAGPGDVLGVLRIGLADAVKLSKREMQVLTTYAGTVSTTLLNARLHSAVRLQAERAAHEAAHDSLTGLSSRNLLLTRAAVSLDDAKRSGATVALLLLDLDHFKEINDTLGHAAGDELLRNLGSRLRVAVPPEATIARLGGDEFAVLLPGLPGSVAASVAAENLLSALVDPVTFEGMRLSIEGSMGVACYPEDGTTVEELLQRADIAMYQAKDDRGAWRRYDPNSDVSNLDRLALVSELHAAIERDELVTYFQPKVDLKTDAVIGYEALVRWRHPTRGLVAPSEFVPVVEHSGLVRQFTLHVLDRAIAECAVWHRTGSFVSVAVNLSARNLLDRQLPDDVARVLARHGLPAESLVLEITETTMMSELDVVEDVLGALRRLGVELSVDDFGTGYSSLALLQRISVNEVKVDRTFVRGMLGAAGDMAIVRATIDLAHALGLRVVAEGVESAALRDRLAELGCDVAQGFHLGMPAPAVAVRAALANCHPTDGRPMGLPHQRRARLAALPQAAD